MGFSTLCITQSLHIEKDHFTESSQKIYQQAVIHTDFIFEDLVPFISFMK